MILYIPLTERVICFSFVAEPSGNITTESAVTVLSPTVTVLSGTVKL